MNRELKSDWWVFSNITFLSLGLGYLITLLLLFIGNFIDVKVSQEIFSVALILVWGISVFFASKITFNSAMLDKKDVAKVLVYNTLLYIAISLRAVPAVLDIARIKINPVLGSYLIPIVLSLVMALFVELMIFNFNTETE